MLNISLGDAPIWEVDGQYFDNLAGLSDYFQAGCLPVRKPTTGTRLSAISFFGKISRV